MNLYQRAIVLRVGIQDILDCNAQGAFFIGGECVPAVMLGHDFSDPAPYSPRAGLAFEDEGGNFPVYGTVGGLDGADALCAPEDVGDDCAPGHEDPACCDEFPDEPICDGGGDECAPGHEDPACCDEFPDEPICDGGGDECVPDTEDRPIDCPEGQVGEIIEERDFLCPQEEWTDWFEVFNNCSDECVEDTRSDTENCPPGQVGWVQTAEQFVCPDAEWQPLPDEAFCCTPLTESRGSCPEGQMGEFTEERNFVCDPATGTGEWTDWEVVTDTCTVGSNWVYVGTYGSVPYGDPPEMIGYFNDSNCGPIWRVDHPGQTTMPFVNSCTPGANCSSAAEDTCLINSRPCVLVSGGPENGSAGKTATIWDRYECQ